MLVSAVGNAKTKFIIVDCWHVVAISDGGSFDDHRWLKVTVVDDMWITTHDSVLKNRENRRMQSEELHLVGDKIIIIHVKTSLCAFSALDARTHWGMWRCWC